MRRVLPVLFALLPALLFVRQAHAEGADSDVNYDPGRAQRRSDFALGVSIAGMFGAATGYPNDANKIDQPQYEGKTGFGGGPNTALWLGAALRDWFVFGVGLSAGTIAGGNGTLSRGGVFLLHLEGFPLFYQGGLFRDLGVVAEAGTGSRDIWSGSTQTATSGNASYVALGLNFEPVRAGKHVSVGPLVLLSHQFSDRFQGTFGIVGVQVAYYGGPD